MINGELGFNIGQNAKQAATSISCHNANDASHSADHSCFNNKLGQNIPSFGLANVKIL